jgi:hypothetical protein
MAIENNIPLEQVFPGEERLAQEAAFLYLLLRNPDAKWIFGTNPDPIDARDLYARDVISTPIPIITKKQVDLSVNCSPVESQKNIRKL